MTDMKTNTEDYLRMYSQMVRIRNFEDQANQLYLSAKMPGLTHMYSGQEAVAVGICEALKVTDKITSTHRGHGHCVAKGADFKEMFCEIVGQGRGLLPRQGWLDAYRGSVQWQSWRKCYCWRLYGDRHWLGLYQPNA